MNTTLRTFVIGGFVNVNTIYCRKELDFRRLTYLDQTTALVGTVVSIAAAFALRNVWALIIGQIAQRVAQMSLSYYFIEGRPKLAFNREIAIELLSYGKFITATSAVIFVAISFDTAVIGKILGPEQLGFYVLAFTISNLVTASLAKVASGIMLPAYSKLQTDVSALRRAYLKTMTFVLFVCLPATVGIMVAADSIVFNVYGAKWANSIPLLQVLVMFGLFRSVHSINGFLFQGIGRPEIEFKISLIQVAALVPLVLLLTVSYGLLGAATAVATAMFIKMAISLVVVSRVIEVSPKAMLSAVGSPVWKSFVMGVLVLAVGVYVDRMTGTGLVILIAVGFITYAVLNLGMIRQIRQQGLQH